MAPRVEVGETWEESALVVQQALSDLKDGQERIEAKILSKWAVVLYGALGGALGSSLGGEIISAALREFLGKVGP